MHIHSWMSSTPFYRRFHLANATRFFIKVWAHGPGTNSPRNTREFVLYITSRHLNITRFDAKSSTQSHLQDLVCVFLHAYPRFNRSFDSSCDCYDSFRPKDGTAADISLCFANVLLQGRLLAWKLF